MKKHLRIVNAPEKEHDLDHKEKVMSEKIGALTQGDFENVYV